MTKPTINSNLEIQAFIRQHQEPLHRMVEGIATKLSTTNPAYRGDAVSEGWLALHRALQITPLDQDFTQIRKYASTWVYHAIRSYLMFGNKLMRGRKAPRVTTYDPQDYLFTRHAETNLWDND